MTCLSGSDNFVHLLIRAGQPDRVRQVLPRVLAGLSRHGRQADAERLRREVEETFQGIDFAPGRRRAAARLPAKCDNCGAPIKPDEVARAGAAAECPYCGGMVKAEWP